MASLLRALPAAEEHRAPAAPHDVSHARWSVTDVAVLAVPVGLFVVHVLRYGQWLVDDALISVAYARSISMGAGLAESPGEPAVEGVSNPTWTLLLAALRLLGLSDRGRSLGGVADTVLVVRVLAVACFVAVLLCVRRTAAALLPTRSLAAGAVLVAGLLLALSPSFVVWSVSGLENPLYGLLAAMLATLLVVADVKERLVDVRVALGSGLLVVLLAGTRPDGALFGLAYPTVLLLRNLRGRLRSTVRPVAVYALAVGLPTAGLLAWRHATFGLWVPNTAVAKSQGLDLRAVPSRVLDLMTAAGPWVVVGSLAVVGLCVVVPGVRRRHLPSSLGLWTVLLLAIGVFVLLNADWMAEYRFATPAAVLGSCLLGVWCMRCLALSPSLRWRVPVGVLVAVLLIGDAVSMLPRVAAFARAPTVPGCFVADRYGRAVDAYADALGIDHATYLVPDIGGVLLTSRTRVIDLAGLTDPTIARYRRDRDWAGLRGHVLTVVRPTFVHLHRPWDAGLARDPRFRRDYVAIVPGADFVRRDAADGAAVEALAPRAKAWAREAYLDRRERPTAGCAALVRRP